MTPNVYVGGQSNLRLELKVGWGRCYTTAGQMFCHGGPMKPGTVRSGGLDAVRFGQEYVVDSASNNAIAGGKLIFSFLVDVTAQNIQTWRKPAAVRRLWGDDGHTYIFSPPTGTEAWCAGGNIESSKEIAFAYRVDSADLSFYCTPSTRGLHGGATLSFQIVPWHVVVAAVM